VRSPFRVLSPGAPRRGQEAAGQPVEFRLKDRGTIASAREADQFPVVRAGERSGGSGHQKTTTRRGVHGGAVLLVTRIGRAGAMVDLGSGMVQKNAPANRSLGSRPGALAQHRCANGNQLTWLYRLGNVHLVAREEHTAAVFRARKRG